MLRQQRDAIIPPDEIERDLSKNFKTAIVEWAENTMEANYTKFSLELLDTEELKLYLATGRYFRNYYVGFDSYKPETWDIERSFVSQDLDITYPQDAEYVGTIHLMAGAQVLSRFGHLIPKKIQDKIYGEDFYGGQTNTLGPMEFLRNGGGIHPSSVPHAGYHQQQTAVAFQNLTGVPMGNTLYRNADGEMDRRYSWATNTRGANHLGWGKSFRDDINTRTDTLQITEAYFRSKKLMGLLTMENPLSEIPYQEFVEEDLIPDFLKYYDIKKQSTKSWKEVTDNPMDNINTITYGFVDEIWKGYKLNAMGTTLKEDYCFGVEPLEYQISSVHNEFEKLIPVGGIISYGIGEMLRPFQTEINIVRNQNRQYLEKTMGTFFTIDWNLLPSQFKGTSGENWAEQMEEWRETIRETGIAVVDNSPQNTKGQNPGQNSIQQFDISFVNNIRANMEIARDLEAQALALVGLTRERIGSPNEYMTNEGIEQGMNASYAQTEIWYKRFNAAKIKEKYIELAIAQHCEVNKGNISIDYINGQQERIIRNFIDPDFEFRKLEVYPSDDSSKRREFETFKNMVLQRNTMDSSLYDLGRLVTSDSFLSVLDYGLELEKKKQADVQAQRQHEQQVAQTQAEGLMQVERQKIANENEQKRLDRESEEYQTEVRARATIADSNADQKVVQQLFDRERIEQKERDNETKNGLRSRELDIKEKKTESEMQSDFSKADELFLKLRESAKDRISQERRSQDKVDVARIND